MEILPTDADDREIISALLMQELLYLFGDTPETAALAALVFRGNERVLDTNTVPLFLESLETFGFGDTWEIFAMSHSFRHIDMPITPNVRLNLNAISQNDCKTFYRFNQDELRRIIPQLPFPHTIITPAGDKAHLIEAFCIVLRRMSSRGKIRDFNRDFGRSQGSVCRIMIYMTHLILQRVGKSVFFYPVTAEQLLRYRDAFRRMGVPECCPIVAVLDNKKQYTCKPTHNQKSQYNQFKKGHGPKHQTLDGPDGLILHQYAGDGRPGDAFIARESGLSEFWRAHPLLRDFRILSDSAFGVNTVFISMYKRRPGEAALPVNRRMMNHKLAPSRTMGVENDYCIVVASWPFVDTKKAMKMEKSPVISYWTLAVWLTNLLTCTHGYNMISNFFHCPPPALEDFMHRTLNY